MEAMLIAIVLTTFIARNGVTDSIALAKGKEAPSLQRQRSRQAKRGGSAARSSKSGKKPSAARTWAGAVKDDAFEQWRQRSHHRHQRRLAWYAETAPQRDEQWKLKQQAKLNRQVAAAEKFAARKGIAWRTGQPVDGDTPHKSDQDSQHNAADAATSAAAEQPAATGASTGGPEPEPASTETSREDDPPAEQVGSWERHAAASSATLPGPRLTDRQEDESTVTYTVEPQPDQTGHPASETDSAHQQAVDTHSPGELDRLFTTTRAAPAAGGAATATNGADMYEQAVTELHAHAEAIDQYRAELTVFTDELGGRGWGEEVTGPLADMDAALGEAAGAYRDLATQMKTQGDAVRDAWDEAPYVPSKDAALA